MSRSSADPSGTNRQTGRLAALTPRIIGTISNHHSDGRQHLIDVALDDGHTLCKGDVVCIGIPAPESREPPLFTINRLQHRGRIIPSVAGPAAICFSTRNNRRMILGEPIFLIVSFPARSRG
ncbi:MAG: hypothetical protein PHH01_03015 [Patescibacteria group bacterium]|nr:hypothetical protein [Patescibacteria group bacterium]